MSSFGDSARSRTARCDTVRASEQEREAGGEGGIANAHGQRDSVAQPIATAAINRKVRTVILAVIGELEREAGLTKHRPMLAEPKVPLHDDRDPSVVFREVHAEAESYAVVDAIDEAFLGENDRAAKAGTG